MAGPPLESDESGIVANLGRPRSVLVVGQRVAGIASAARARGSHVTAVELDPDAFDSARDAADAVYRGKPTAALDAVPAGRFDLVIARSLSDALERTLPAMVSRLTDGGHVLLTQRAGREVRDATAVQLEHAGLELMRVDPGPHAFRSRAPVKRASGKPSAPDDIVPISEVQADQRRAAALGIRRALHGMARVIASTGGRTDDDLVFVARVPPKKGPLSLTIGMLTLNEKESVERMIGDIRRVVRDAKILLVDSSSDETPTIAEAHGARVVRQLPPRGHGPAMERLMYEAALETDALIYLDCDFTYPVEVIPRIHDLLEAGADVVNASRTAKYPEAMPIANFLANRVFAGTAEIVHGVPTTDVHSGMRGYRSSVIRAFDFSGEGDALPLDTLILPARSNYEVVEFPIPYQERVGVSKLAKLRGTLWTFIRIAGAIGEGDRVRRNRHYRLEV
jgi:hypothetical protein